MFLPSWAHWTSNQRSAAGKTSYAGARSVTVRPVRVLVCWVGNTDLRASQGEAAAGLGPIGQALQGLEFDQVVLLSNYPKKDTTSYVRWARAHTTANVTLRQVALEDPTHFASIYKLADEALEELRAAARKNREDLELTLHLSPGTPVMAAVWVVLG
ncbi:MAG: hypothetical protein RJA70_3260, partial [Pseudomonadota bacterium]